MYDWQVQIQQPGYTQEVEVYIFRQYLPDERQFLIKGGTETKAVKKIERPIRTDELVFCLLPDQETAALLLQALEKKGFPSPNNNFVAGELIATKKHLDDMRSLVFKQPKPLVLKKEKYHE